MTLINRTRAAWRYLGEFAEAMEYDPLNELRLRVARLERQSGIDPQHSAPVVTELPAWSTQRREILKGEAS